MEDYGDRHGDRFSGQRRLRRQSGLSDNQGPDSPPDGSPERTDHLDENDPEDTRGDTRGEALGDRRSSAEPPGTPDGLARDFPNVPGEPVGTDGLEPDRASDERSDERSGSPSDGLSGGPPGGPPGGPSGGAPYPPAEVSGGVSGPVTEGFEDRKDQYTIGEVVARLRREFPTLSVSKVRYLERRRLINLTRTRGGYRLFSGQDVEMLRYILTLQDKEYLPLKVIKKRIDAGAPSSLSQEGGGEFSRVLEDRTYTREELAESLEVETRFVDDLLSVQVIGRTGEISQKDAEIARMALELSKYGIQPRHLRGIMAGVEREAAMFKQILNPELRANDEQRVAEAMHKARHLASIDAKLKELMMANLVDNFSS